MENILKEIIEAGTYAPSGDNSQPWSFEIRKPNKIYLYNIPDRDNPIFNFKQAGSHVAHGAVLENMSITSSHFGYSADITLFPDDNKKAVASVVLTNPISEKDDLYPHIKERITNRRPYDRKRILDNSMREKIAQAANHAKEGRLFLVQDAEKLQKLGKALSTTEQIVLETPGLHNFFFSHICWSEKEEKTKKSGLYIKTIELSPPQRLAFSVFRYWPLMNALNKFHIAKFISRENGKLYASASAIGIVVMPNNTKKDFIMAGRMMQRIWLTATKLGLSFHPITGIPFLMQRVFAGATDPLSEPHVLKITTAYNTIKEIFGINNGFIVIPFRIGFSKKPSARSSRLPPQINYTE
jgi:nitroreductase